MRSLLDDLRRAPTPLAIVSRNHLADGIKSAYASLLRAALFPQVGREDLGPALVELRRYAIWLEDAALDGELEGNEAQSAINLAATLHEFAGRIVSPEGAETIFQSPLNDLLRSAILGSHTGYGAQPSLAARRLKERVSGLETASSVQQLHRLVALVIVSFLGREFHDAFSEATRLRFLASDAVTELRERDANNIEYLEVDRATAMALACGNASAGMLVGAADLVQAGAEALRDAADAAKESEDEQRYWLAQRLASVADDMHEGSMHRLLYEAGIPVEFRRALAREGFLELWGPQREAIEKGLLSPGEADNFVVTIPTGAGKTLVAELAILNALKGDDPSWAVYVAPSRALVNQVSSDLRRRLEGAGVSVRTVLAGAEQGAALDAELELLSAERSVTVTTPEKLDAYYRNAKELFDSCTLAVFDEVQKVDEPDRGPLIESLITRFLTLQPGTRLLLLSGVLSNHAELVSWLGGDNTQSVVAKRRPTRQVRGLAVRHDLEVEPERTTRAGSVLRKVNFAGGLLLVAEDEDIEPPLDIQLPDLFRGYQTERLRLRSWRRQSEGSTSKNDHAIAIAGVLARAPGTTLVFVERPDWAESCCGRLVLEESDELRQERNQLARFVAAELGDEHDLVEHCRRGAAFHHARLPSGVQRAIELGLERGWLKVVFATPTLREGLNTAATNVILAGNTYWDSESGRRIDIKEADFENLAGRAGRPLREAEGLVVLVPDSMAVASAIQAGGKYLLVGEQALRAQTQLGALVDQLEKCEGDMRNLSEPHQSLLLGLKAAGLDEEDSLATFFAQSLWSVQDEDEERQASASAATAATFVQAEETLGQESLQVASRTGLSLSSVEILLEKLGEHAEVLAEKLVPPEDRSDELLPHLVEAALLLPEVRKGALKGDIEWEAHVEPVRQWISGQPYQEILSSAVDSGVLKSGSDLGAAVRYCADVSTWLSWAFGASYMILESLVDTVDSWVGIVPLLTKYGVSSPAAAYLSLLGIANRSDAEVLAQRFNDTGEPASLGSVSDWLPKAESELEEIFPQMELRSELMRRQVFGVRREPLPYMFARVRAEGALTPGQVLSLDRRQDDIVAVDTATGQAAVFFDGEQVFNFMRGAPEEAVAIVTSPPREGSAAVAVVRLAAAG